MPPKIFLDPAVRLEPGSQVPCLATGTPPIYMALIRNFTVLMNKTYIIYHYAGSKLYQEGNYTCVATSYSGIDVKHFVIKGGEKIRYFKTNTIHTELRLAIWHIIIVSRNRRREGFEEGRICSHAFLTFLIFQICSCDNATKCWEFMWSFGLKAICNLAQQSNVSFSKSWNKRTTRNPNGR